MASRTSLHIRAPVALLVSACWASAALAQPTCAGSIGELRAMLGDPAFATTWNETTMDDGKPLTVSLHDGQGGLLLRFMKAHEGLWAESSGPICRHESELRFSAGEGQFRMGPAANWLLRTALAKGGTFAMSRLAADRLRISTRGWSGEFVPAAPR